MLKKKITYKKYNKIMDKIISNKKLPVHEILEKLIEEASKYTIKGMKEDKPMCPSG